MFDDFNPLKIPLEVTLGDGHALKATAHGTMILKVKFNCGTRKCKLYDVLYVPELSYNLLSVSKAVEKRYFVTFSESSCVIRNVNSKPITVASKVSGLYH